VVISGRRPGMPVRRCTIDRGQADLDTWPYTLPAVRHVVNRGLDLDAGVTVLVGENGSGKSTLVEAIAAVWGRRISSFRADVVQRVVSEPSAEDSELHRSLRLEYTAGGPTGGFFLRAERMHSLAGVLASGGRWEDRLGGIPILDQSHGEGFLRVLAGMTHEAGLYILDEPESALSFSSSLALLQILADLRAAGSQVILATHSPILASLPDCLLLELSPGGISEISYEDSDLVTSWRSFLDAPGRYHRHLNAARQTGC
jgi:predicted ATPase